MKVIPKRVARTKFDIYVFISGIFDYYNREKLATQGTQDKTKQKHNTTCVGHQYTHTNTNNVNKT